MLRQFAMMVCLFVFSSCQTTAEPVSLKAMPHRLPELQMLFQIRAFEAVFLRDGATGWLINDDCDGMLWSAKSAVADCSAFEPGAAEFEPGKFGRRPAPRCYDAQTGADNGAKSTWSRDMGLGLYAFAWKCGGREYLERHRNYGYRNNWKMGDPIADGRTIYTPNMISLLHEIIYRLGGADSKNRFLPVFYPPGARDYEAHLQMMHIWLRHETSGKLGWLAKRRIKEHMRREKHNPFYQYMNSLVGGSHQTAIDLLLDPNMPMSGYVRCNEEYRCKLAEWLFVTSLVLERYL